MDVIIVLSIVEIFFILVAICLWAGDRSKGPGIAGTLLVATILISCIVGAVTLLAMKFPFTEVLNEDEFYLLLWVIVNFLLWFVSMYFVWYLKVLHDDRQRLRDN